MSDGLVDAADDRRTRDGGIDLPRDVALPLTAGDVAAASSIVCARRPVLMAITAALLASLPITKCVAGSA